MELDQVEEIQRFLRDSLMNHKGPLVVSKDSEAVIEFIGTQPVMQGKQKVNGHYFASVVPKPKDCRLYFFPIYTHSESYSLSEDLKKCLKGKSCFHFKKLSDQLQNEIKEMIDKGIHIYQENNLI